MPKTNFSKNLLCYNNCKQIGKFPLENLQIADLVLDFVEMFVGAEDQTPAHHCRRRHTHFIKRIDAEETGLIARLKHVSIAVFA